MTDTASPRIGGIRTAPANQASRDDLETVFSGRGDPPDCRCQWFKLRNAEWRETTEEQRAEALAEQTRCGIPTARSTSGLLAYLDGEPVGWVAVEPRTAYPRLLASRLPWTGRDEDKTDEGVWAITCFVTRVGFRGRGVSRALAAAAVEHARARGARAVEGYPRAAPGSAAEMFHGSVGAFAAAGLAEVSRPSAVRAVMRLDF